MIDQINRFIELNGNFTTSDAEATCSPVISSVNKNHFVLAERFYKNSCEGFEYVHETETGSDDYEYSELDLDTLYDILNLAEQWDVICFKTQKRCSSN